MNSRASRYFARIVRAIIVSSLGIGGGIGLLTFIAILVTTGKQGALQVAVQAGFVIGIGFGVIYAVLLLLWDLSWRLDAAKQLKDEVWELEQTREIEVEGTLKDARAMSRQALLAVPQIKAVADTDNERETDASTGPSWKSPGERLHVWISDGGGDSMWTVRCTSACLAKSVAFDYGKNFENVEMWLRTMRRLKETGLPDGGGGGGAGGTSSPAKSR